MRRALDVTLLFTLSLLMAASVAAWSQDATTFTPAELDELLAPIALYSDPLLAQILPAATYPDQLNAASDLVTFQGGSGMIDDQAWDVSVKSVAHYPSVLKMMVDSPDWTISVGQAYVNQPDDVMSSLQRLRGRARLNGYLSSNSYQTVAYSNGYTSIVPAQARYMYVPTYDPQVVYVTRRSSNSSNIIAFGLGLLIGAWLNNSIDWNRNRVYNHGWNGGGWIGRSRQYVQTNNPYYAGRPVTVNRNVRTLDTTGYRQDLKRGAGTFRTPGLMRPAGPAPTVSPRTSTTRPGNVRPGVRSNAGVAAPAPWAKPRVPTAPSSVRPGAVVPATTPDAGPHPTFTRPGTTPNAGVARPSPVTRPNTPMARPVPKPNSGVTTPSPRGRFGTPSARPTAGVARPSPQASPNAPAVRSTPRANAGKSGQAPAFGGKTTTSPPATAVGQSKSTTNSGGKADTAKGKRSKNKKK